LFKKLPFLALLALAGCANLAVMRSVPMSTISRLAALDLGTISPSELRIAARLPPGLEPRPGGATVRLQWSAAGNKETLNFVLREELAPEEAGRLARYETAGAHIWIFRLSEGDVTRLNVARYRALKAAVPVALSVSADVAVCRSVGLSTGALLTTTYLRTDGADYFPLSENLDLRSIASDQELASKVPPCQ